MSGSCLSADDDALAAGRAGNVLVIGGRTAGLLIGVATAGAATVKLDTVASAGDAVAFTRAGGAGGVV